MATPKPRSRAYPVRWETEFPGSNLNLAGWTKKLTGKPTITVGSVGLADDLFSSFDGTPAAVAGLEQLVEMLARGEYDLVALGRALISDPAWARKALAGRLDEMVTFDRTHLRELI